MRKKDPAELYRERWSRVMDAVALKKPDRVPLIPQIEAVAEYYSGITVREAMYDYRKAAAALDRFYADFQPDLGWGPGLMYYAPAMESCGLKWLRWPGNGIQEAQQMYQFIEGEFMLPEEYEELIHDPTHFIQSKWIPRCFTKLRGLEKLRLRDSIWGGFFGTFAAFADAEVIESLENLIETGKQLAEWFAFCGEYEAKMEKELGLPLAVGANGFAPFDQLGDTLRGTVNVMVDVLERPEKVVRAVEALLPIALEAPIAACQANGRKTVWIWLHKGVDEFMSVAQYKTFYWPTLQKMIVGLVEAGLTPFVYCEGSYNTRLEVLRDVPAGKVVYDFEKVDMFKAKEILGDVACIAGNLPNAMLLYGGPDEVDRYCRELIEGVGRDGGFMLDAGGLIDNANVENLRAMFDSVEKYGRA
jgi:hypothetical protein